MKGDFSKFLDEVIAKKCKSLGFEKKKYVFCKDFENGWIATLSFGTASHSLKEGVLVCPNIGMLNYKASALLDQLTTGLESKKLKQINPAISIALGYVTPQNSYTEWTFMRHTEIEDELNNMFDSINKYAFPFYEKMSREDNFFEAIEKRSPGVMNHIRDKYLPILYYLRGEKQKGLEVIKESIARQNQPVDVDEIKKSRGDKETIVIRAGIDKLGNRSYDDMLKSLPEGGSIVMVGSGYGKVDPEYLKFAKMFSYFLIRMQSHLLVFVNKLKLGYLE